MASDKILSKQIFKKWWFWVIVVVILGVIGLFMQDDTTTTNTANNSDNTSNSSKQAVTYTVTGETLGEYGKEITLNQNSDMPTKKYLYKLPVGTYKVTTLFNKMASFYIVKDETTTESNSEYPEALNYVGEAYLLTAGDDDFNGKAKKEVTITLNADESVQVVGTETFVFEKQ